MKKKVCALFIVVTVIVLIAAGCRSNGSVTPSETNNVTDAGETSTTSTKTSLKIAVGSDFQNIVPLSNNIAVGNKDGAIIFALYDPLVWRDSDDGSIKPCIAKEWEISDDGLTYTLKLRDDVTFHNGMKMTANDVAWSLNLLLDNPAVSKGNFPTFEKAEVIDDYTVKIYLTAPFAPMINALASYHIVVLSKDYFDKVGSFDEYIKQPIGTGPYEYVSKVPGSTYTLKAYNGYWDGAPAIKDLTFKILPDSNAQVIALESEDVDVLLNGSISNMVRIDSGKGVERDSREAASTCLLMFNGRDTLMADENLRKAILSAVDYDGINKAINGGYTKDANCIVPVGITARPEDGTFKNALKYNIEAAKVFLEKSSYQKSRALRVLCVSGSREENIAKVLQGNLQEIGIDAQITAVDASMFSTIGMKGDFELQLFNIMPSLFDMNVLYQLFDPSIPTNVGNMYPDFKELGQLGYAAASEMNQEKRIEYYREMMDLVNDHAYAGFIFHDMNTVAWRTGLKGVKALPSTNYRISNWSW